MVRIIILLLSSAFIHSCAQTKRLENGTRVLTKKFKNVDKFNKSILNDISVDYFYKKIDYYMADKNFNKIRDVGSDVNRSLQFYPNGRVRFFSLDIENPNPEFAGRRGIIYMKNNSIKIDTQFSDQDGHISKGTYSVKIVGDNIYLLDNNFLFSQSEYICFVYQKSEKIPEDWKKYKVDW